MELEEFNRLVHSLGYRPSSSTHSDARASHSQPVDSRIRSTFDRFDANRSGRLDYRELRNCLNAMGIDVTSRDAAGVIARYDANSSGLMELDEFARLVYQLGYRPEARRVSYAN